MDFVDDLPDDTDEVRYQRHARFLRTLKEDTLLIVDNFNVTAGEDPEMGVRDDADEPINSGKVGMYFSPWWKICYGTPDAYRNDPTANWKSYIVFTDEGKWYTREQSPVASHCIFNKNISEDVAKAVIIMNNVWVRDESLLTTGMGQNDAGDH